MSEERAHSFSASSDRDHAKAGTSQQRAIRVLTFTSLFPSAVQPRHGIFVETRLQHLIRDCQIDARVVVPVPWFPFKNSIFGRYAKAAQIGREETRQMGLRVSTKIPCLG